MNETNTDLNELLTKLSTMTYNYDVHIRYSRSQLEWYCYYKSYGSPKFGQTPIEAATKLYEWVLREQKETEK